MSRIYIDNTSREGLINYITQIRLISSKEREELIKNQSVIPFDRTAIQKIPYNNDLKKELIAKLESSPFFSNLEVNTFRARQRLAGVKALSNGSHRPREKELIENILKNNNVKKTYLTQSTHNRHIAILKMKQNKIERELKENSPTIKNLEMIAKKITGLKTYYNQYKDEVKFNENIIRKLTNKYTNLLNNRKILNNKEKRLTNWGFNTRFEVNKGLPIKRGGKKYINLQSGGGKRLVHYGSRGGRYYMKGGNKVYI